jgi:hypothetical protein
MMVQIAALMISRWFCGQLLVVLRFNFTTSVWILFLMIQVAGVFTLSMALIVMMRGPLARRNFQVLHGFSTRNAPWLMGFRYRWFINPSLWISWWLLRCEVVYLHARMIDIEGIFQALDEYLTGGQTLIGAAQELADNGEPLVEHQDKPMAEPFGPDDHRWVLAVTLGSHIIECWFVNAKK